MRRFIYVLVVAQLAIGLSAGVAHATTGAKLAWRSQHVPVPAHFLATNFTAVSCSSSTFCAATGSVSAVWRGSSWMLTPNAAGKFVVADVACATRLSCVAVGNFTNSTTHFLFAEKWNGGKWSLTSNPKIPQADEPFDTASFTSISCPAVAFCLAVGNFSNENGSGPFAEIWNGLHWTLTKPVPTPKGSSPSTTVSVSCDSRFACLAVGNYYTDFAEKEYALADLWVGRWVDVSPPQSRNIDPLSAVSCASATWCMAIGEQSTGINLQPANVAERWSDGRWTTYSRADFLSAISCSSSTFCMTIGQTSFPTTQVYATWIGKTWSRFKNFGVGGAYAAVSCTSNAACTATGVRSKIAAAARYSTKS